MTGREYAALIDAPDPGPFFVFAGADYYPCGGVGDCQGIFPTLEEAIDTLIFHTSGDWGTVEVIRARQFVTLFDRWEGIVHE